ARPRRLRHRLDRRAPVAPVGLDLEVAAQVAVLDQLRQPPLARRLDLAGVLAQLRRDPRESERRVDLLLRLAREPPAPVEEAVLVQLEAARLGDAAQRHVVRLAPGEVAERGAEALLGH